MMTSLTTSLTSTVKENAISCSTCICTSQEPRALSCMHSCCLQCLEHNLESSLSRDSTGGLLCGKAELVVPSAVEVTADTVQEFSVAQNSKIDCHINAVRTSDFDTSDLSIGIGIPAKKLKLMTLADQSDHLTNEQDEPVHCMKGTSIFQSSVTADCKVGVHCKCCNLLDSQVIASENEHRVDASIVESLIVGASCCRNLLKTIDCKMTDVIHSTSNAELEICDTAERLKNLVEEHKRQALSSLATTKQNRMLQLDSLRSLVEQRLLLLQKSMNKTKSLGNDVDAVLEVAPIHRKSDEISKLDEMERAVKENCSFDISFLTSDAMSSQVGNVVGKISDTSAHTVTEKSDVRTSPSLSHVVPRGSAVIGVTLVGDQLFVLRWPSQQQIEVYDAETFVFRRPLSVPGLSGRPGGLASCAANNCVYVSDFQTSTLYRIGLAENHKATLMRWPVDRQPTGLSVNSARDVLVICRGSPHKIQEYTSHGLLVREVPLPASVTRPMHAVQLSTGQFLVANGGTLPGQFGCGSGELHRVTLIDADGSSVRSYGNTFGSSDGHLDEPMQLALCEASGFVLVAVKESHRVVIIDPTLTSARDLALDVPGGGLRAPISLCFSEASGRLFVGEGTGGRLFVFDNVTDVGNY